MRESLQVQDDFGSPEELAAITGRLGEISARPEDFGRFRTRITNLEIVLRTLLQKLMSGTNLEVRQSRAGEWLIDNDYRIQEAVTLVKESLKRGFLKRLPTFQTGPFSGRSRAYALARVIVESEKATIDIDWLVRFLDAYPHYLTIGEVWALPTMLRLVVLETLASQTSSLFEAYGDKTALPEFENAELDERAQENDYEERIINCVSSLHRLATLDWKIFFESVSRVERILREDPADVYSQMDFASRDDYRSTLERIARRSGQSEELIARSVIDLARNTSETSPPRRHVGYYLVDSEGQKILAEQLRYDLPWYRRLIDFMGKRTLLIYVSSILAITSLLTLWLCKYALAAGPLSTLGLLFLAVILFTPASVFAFELVNFLTVLLVRPSFLPKLDFTSGIPASHWTVIAVPSLIGEEEDARSLLKRLELHYLGNQDRNLCFAALTGFPDARAEKLEGEEKMVAQMVEGIEYLNQQYGTRLRRPFILFHRERLWNPQEGKWMGWERKRGLLHEFNQVILGKKARSAHQIFGNSQVLRRIRFVVTLDADTVLPPESARRMVGTLAHPLNRARFKAGSNHVERGYTVLQPRIEIDPERTDQTRFSRVLSGEKGLDLYSHAVSDVYQDLFSEGNYAGKGIYEVAKFERSVCGRIPDNSLLSHDLLEGLLGRSGLMSDVPVLEDFPPSVPGYVERMHRWVRGDWQLLPWLLGFLPRQQPGSLTILDRWKILDNLRRSLVTPSVLLLLLSGWIWLPGSVWLWTIFSATVLAAPLFPSALTSLRRLATPQLVLRGMGWSLRLESSRWLLAIVLIPFAAVRVVDAILRTLIRLLYTRKHLLEWTPASHSSYRQLQDSPAWLFWKRMWPAPALAGAGFLAVLAVHPSNIWAALPFLILWGLSPQISAWLSQAPPHAEESLSPEQEQNVRTLARRTWSFFERFVGPEDHWLAPDHYQEDPRGIVARRTSPTDLGMLLLATVAAYDLGYLTSSAVSARLLNTLENMAKLERYRGHFLNWYETGTLNSLEPRYVSTVDSGNLSAALLTVKESCTSILKVPLLRRQQREGILDTIATFRESLSSLRLSKLDSAILAILERLDELEKDIIACPPGPRWAAAVNRLCEETAPSCHELLGDLLDAGGGILHPSTLRELRTYSSLLHESLFQTRKEIESLVPWEILLNEPPDFYHPEKIPEELAAPWNSMQVLLDGSSPLEDIPEACRLGLERLSQLDQILRHSTRNKEITAALDWNSRLRSALTESERATTDLVNDLEKLKQTAEGYFQEADFSFLFDQQRQVFHLGYNCSTGRLDPNYYDLLASEARLASLVAIARGDVPYSHWIHLGRPFSRSNGTPVLLSWGGTIFEYLLPSLLLRMPRKTLLTQACHAAVDVQIEFAKRARIPWGISESAYYQFDRNFNYQYRAFGVPGLGLAQGLGERRVVSPYSSCMAIAVRPRQAMQNLADLREKGVLGLYGFYEAIDFGYSQAGPEPAGKIVQSYMIHHQGMILVALANFLKDDLLKTRFHSDPRISSVDSLIYEEIPAGVPASDQWRKYAFSAPLRRRPREARRWPVNLEHSCLQTQLISNGRLSVLVAADGGGYCWRRNFSLTRRSDDYTYSQTGTWFYIRDADTGILWSAGSQPIPAPPGRMEVYFSPYSAQTTRREEGILAIMETIIGTEDDVELRRLRLHNETDRRRRLQVVSYAEPTLTPGDEYRRHPAYSKLFVESSFLEQQQVLLFHRRPRSSVEEPVYMAHSVVTGPEPVRRFSWDTDRACFLGRGGSVRSPEALKRGLDGHTMTAGAVLDPMMSTGCEVELSPYGETEITFLTAAGDNPSTLISMLERYRSLERIQRGFEQARRRSEHELRQLRITASEAQLYQELLSSVLRPPPQIRSRRTRPAGDPGSQSDLWKFGISGDLPIVLIRMASSADAVFLEPLLKAQHLWRLRGLEVDLVVISEEPAGYAQPLRDRLAALLEGTVTDVTELRGVFVLPAEELEGQDLRTLETAARLVLSPEEGELKEQLGRLRESGLSLPGFVPTPSAPPTEEDTPPIERPPDLLFPNRWGGFTPDGKEYVTCLPPGRKTPAPWVNVIANRHFGCLVSESSFIYTWSGNSSEHRLTPWSNDWIQDPPGEVLYLRDEETGTVWSSTPSPRPAPAPYLVRHGTGYSTFHLRSFGLEQECHLSVDPEEPVKIVSLRLTNLWNRVRRVTATYYLEWTLGNLRDLTSHFILSEYDTELGALLASNPFEQAGLNGIAFLASDQPPHGVTGNRTEFLGRQGDLRRPEALFRIGLGSDVRFGLDPCAALQVHVNLAPGETREVNFLIGEAATREHLVSLLQHFRRADSIKQSQTLIRSFWDDLTGRLTVRTPDPAVDLLLNRWLPYQNLSCRIWGRSAFYQSGGAYGYRDQLQDMMALLPLDPDQVRSYILEAARHQFPEGDVLHWWHPGREVARGVRTRCSDDLLWLPFCCSHYVAATADPSILEEDAPFLQGEILGVGEEERYAEFGWGEERATVYEHCRRAIQHALRFGPHGLPLIGSGDWNDSLNRVGIKGRGESVWLGWFLYAVIQQFLRLPVPETAQDDRERLQEDAENLRRALEENAWDGQWYRRAYFDDGRPLGSRENEECRIDLIAQAWSVLSGAGDRSRASTAMESARRQLFREDARLLLLLTPPFNKTHWDPGYIQAYPPGVRENGGQYTHGAIWGVWALAEQGHGDLAMDLFRWLNPVLRTSNDSEAERYRVEPYVMAADIYGEAPHLGRGGWTWYTGSGGWMYRLGIEGLLGFRLKGDHIQIHPRIASSWQEYEIRYRYGEATYRITVTNPDAAQCGVQKVVLDGSLLADSKIPLRDDGADHEVRVQLGVVRQS